jgi:hypothetical protein
MTLSKNQVSGNIFLWMEEKQSVNYQFYVLNDCLTIHMNTCIVNTQIISFSTEMSASAHTGVHIWYKYLNLKAFRTAKFKL